MTDYNEAHDGGAFANRNKRKSGSTVSKDAFAESLNRNKADDGGIDWSQASFHDDGVSPELADTDGQAVLRQQQRDVITRNGGQVKDMRPNGKTNGERQSFADRGSNRFPDRNSGSRQ